ncbi:hypothetical protein NQ318_021656 [Aromia moschata]|uniref:DNA-directed DNA polymerase n=1 Tax=Aromia moschata TaxID=1265417 RepID=A0AAV8XTD1_9CUCU|nr:hypothetical protein NQ318_021656 [Aromia moschata]
MRNGALNKFKKDFYKLMNNAVFGKTMENVENRRDIRLLTHWEKKWSQAIHLSALKVMYNKPIYIGFSILELSKTVLYDFFYNVIKKHYGTNASLLYTDTDSLIIKVYTDNFYNFIKDNQNEFDTSNYNADNKFNVPVSQSVLGKMKDEFPADPIICFYGTGAKAYYVQSMENELKKAKGVKKCVINNQLTIGDYKKIVENGGLIFRKMNTFTTYLHDMYTEMKNKVALSYNDDKRFIIPNTSKTLAWGHNDITFFQTSPEQNLRWLISAMNKLDENIIDSERNSEFCSSEQNLDDLLAAIEDLKNN